MATSGVQTTGDMASLSRISGLLAVLVVAAGVKADDALPTKMDLINKQMAIDFQCSKDHNVVPNYFMEFLIGNETISENGKCFIKCGMVGMNYLSPDGVLNLPLEEQVSKIYFDQPQQQEFVYNTWVTCDSQCHSDSYTDDSCERAWQLSLCFFGALQKAGIYILPQPPSQ